MSYTETIKLLNRIERAVDEYAAREGDLPARIVVSREAWDSITFPSDGMHSAMGIVRILFGCRVMVLPAERMGGKEFELR